jgi:hypothetical protein
MFGPYSVVRSSLRRIVPARVKAIRSRHRLAKFDRSVAGDSTQDIFKAVYAQRMWVGSKSAKYSSGSGSHDSRIVGPYIASVSRFVESLDFPPDAVDLGCGDFAIGAALRPLFNRYIACDIVPEVLAENRVRYKELDVDFWLIDVANDDLPPGDVVFVRQVLQHLSNDQIARALEKIRTTYPRLILTEHLPVDPHFIPNIDIKTGPSTRLAVRSGVDITKPPFEISAAYSEVLCEVRLKTTRIRTTLYNF